jgi:hypothetical protein
MHSEQYINHLAAGPFPGVIDPWAELPRTFQSVHSGMIESILAQLRIPLLQRGYLIGKETSLQVIENRAPDLYVEIGSYTPQVTPDWNYAQAAANVLAPPDTQAETPEWQALYIRALKPSQLVCVVEIISPSNKMQPFVMESYVERRHQMINQQRINIVEVDTTRSIKRLFDSPETVMHPYHTVIFLPGERPYLWLTDLLQPMKPFALPLRSDVLPVNVQAAYDTAYRNALIAGHLDHHGYYTLDNLPFPTLLSAEHRTQVMQQVVAWQTQLRDLT